MTTIVLEVPDELADRLRPLQAQLPQLLSLALDLLGIPSDESPLTTGESLLSREIVSFLAQGPSHPDIIAFKLSAQAQTRLEELLDQNRESSLTSQEKAELDTYQQANHLLILLKARARALFSPLN